MMFRLGAKQRQQNCWSDAGPFSDLNARSKTTASAEKLLEGSGSAEATIFGKKMAGQ
jgi:hypothetical protein